MAKKIKRAKVKVHKAPPSFSAPITPEQALHEINARAKLQYGPQLGQLNTLQQHVPGWFDSYRQTIGQAQAGVRARTDATVGDIAGRAATGLQASGRMIAGVQAANQGDAASRGGTASGQVNTDAANAAAVRNQQGNAFADLARTQGNVNDTYLSNRSASSGATEASSLVDIARALAAVKADQGAYKVGEYGKIRDAERTYGLQRKAFGLDQQKAALDAVPTPGEQKTAADLAFFQQHGYYPPTGPPKAKLKGGLTPAQRAAAKSKEAARVGKVRDTSSTQLGRLDDVNGRWHLYATHKVTELDPATGKPKLKDGKPVMRTPTPSEITQRILGEAGPDGHKFSTAELHLARLIRDGVPFTPADVAMAHRLKIRVPRALIHPPSGVGKGISQGATGQRYDTSRT